MGGHTLWSPSRQHYIWLARLFYTQHIVCQRKSHSFFYKKKRPLRRERRGQLGKKLIHPPLGLIQSLHTHNVKAVIALSCVLQLKFNIKSSIDKSIQLLFCLFFNSPIKPGTHKNKSGKNQLNGWKIIGDRKLYLPYGPITCALIRCFSPCYCLLRYLRFWPCFSARL